MTSIVACARSSSVKVLALAAAISVHVGSAAVAEDEGVSPGFFQQHIWGNGTLGYGGFATFPGFPGFGLSFHAGYGYGGNGLGLVHLEVIRFTAARDIRTRRRCSGGAVE